MDQEEVSNLYTIVALFFEALILQFLHLHFYQLWDFMSASGSHKNILLSQYNENFKNMQ